MGNCRDGEWDVKFFSSAVTRDVDAAQRGCLRRWGRLGPGDMGFGHFDIFRGRGTVF